MPVNHKLARENYDRWAYIRDNGHLDFTKKADLCENYFAGQQWDERIKAKLEREGRPALTINKTLSTLAVVFGNQIEQGADVAFRPFRDGNKQTATALTKTYMHVMNDNNLPFMESEVAADGFITSRGFYDVRMDFSENTLQGDIRITVPNPKNVGIDPDAENYDPKTWKDVTITKWLTPDEIATLYNKADAKYLETKQASNFDLGYDSIDRDTIGGHRGDPDNQSNQDPHHRRIRVIERQHKKLRRMDHFVDMRTGETRPVPDTWDEERIDQVKGIYGLEVISRTVEQIRWTVSADEVVLHDEWSPYQYFTIVPFFPYFRRGRTIGLVEVQISPQDLLNKSMSQFLHIINTSANSGWKVKTGSLQNMDPEDLEARGAESGLVLELDDISHAEKISPNQVPTGHDRVVYLSQEFMKDVTGISDSMRGMDRADVAARAIEAKQNAGQVNLAKPFHNLAWTRQMLAVRVLSLLQTFYTEERTLQITGSGLQAETEEITINQATPEGEFLNDLTVGEYEVVIVPAPARKSMEEGTFQEALAMRREGIMIPDHVIVEASNLHNKAEIVEEMKALLGGVEPTEQQQQLLELEAQAAQVDLMVKQADAQLKQANAALAQARAQKTVMDAQKEAAQDGQQAVDPVEAARMQSEAQRWGEELQFKREQLAMQREEIVEQLALKRESMLVDAQIKREKIQSDAQAQRRQQVAQAMAARSNPPRQESA